MYLMGDISGSTYSCTYLYLVVPATTGRQAGAVQESVQKRSPSIFMPSTQRRQFSRLRNVCAIPVSRARAICFPSANLFVQIILVAKLFAIAADRQQPRVHFLASIHHIRQHPHPISSNIISCTTRSNSLPITPATTARLINRQDK